MKRTRYLAISLTLVAVILIAAFVHGLLLDRQSALAYGYSPLYEAALVDATDGSGPAPDTVYVSDDAYPGERWGLARIEAAGAWQITRADESVVVAVLDTGISKDNPALAGKLVAEMNFTGSPTCDDLYGHGTHMAGTIAAVAPGCSLMNVKVADDTGRCDAAVVARGIIWAVDNGATVINLSLSISGSPALQEAIDYAWSRGAVVVAAAGNRGGSDPSYPAYYANSIAVAGTNQNDSLALLSNHGDWVDVAAPGFNIYSELPHDRYGYKTGTSAAAAHVSGVAALVLSVCEDSNGSGAVNDEVRRAIEGSCVSLAQDGMGWGLVNASGAVTTSLSTP